MEPQVSWCPGGRVGGGVNVFHCTACHQHVSGSGLAELKLQASGELLGCDFGHIAYLSA